MLPVNTAAETLHPMAKNNKENSAPAPTRNALTPGTTPTPTSQHPHLYTTNMEDTDSEEEAEIVESELLTDTEFEQVKEDGIDTCHYRNPIQVRPVPDSPSLNYSSTAGTLPT